MRCDVQHLQVHLLSEEKSKFLWPGQGAVVRLIRCAVQGILAEDLQTCNHLLKVFLLLSLVFLPNLLNLNFFFSSHHNSCKNKNVNTFLLLEIYNLEKKTPLHCDALEKRIDLTIC